MKYLLLITIALVLWWAWKKRSNLAGGNVPPAVKKAESIVECAHCGVLHPLSDSLADGADQYCCIAHRSAGKK